MIWNVSTDQGTFSVALSCSSFGDPNAQPPTPRQTPTSAVFPSPVFETPQLQQSQPQFTDTGSWTPSFAEDYSVFNSTPGNLRGTQGPFPDLSPATPASQTGGHKRFLSAESVVTPHANPFSPDPNSQLPPVDPAHRVPSTPVSLHFPNDHPPSSDPQPSVSPSLKRSSKKARRGTLQAAEQQGQTATPPPSTRKGERRLAPKLNMQDEQSFSQPDFAGSSQPQDLSLLIGNSVDMFSYPMSAPVTAPDTFWDPSTMAMGMDMDFTAPMPNLFQPGTPAHRHSISFDWNSDIQLFQDPHEQPQQVLPPAPNQENTQPARRERALAPKPPAAHQASTSVMTSTSMAPPHQSSVDDSFNMIGSGMMGNHSGGVNPGMLFSRTQTSAMDASLSKPTGRPKTAAPLLPKELGLGPIGPDNSQPGTVKELKQGKLPDRPFASSPIKPSSGRPGLTRSFSENRGRKPIGRGPPLNPISASRPISQSSSGSAIDTNRGRPSGRISPLKMQQRLSGLASIPESASRLGPRPTVKFTIDSRGRARAERATAPGDVDPAIAMARPRSALHSDVDDELDESSSDDEPIIIPSRNTSFNASFALPDPRKPIGSIFHSSRRSVSDRSTSTVTASEAANGINDVESEAETIMNDGQEQGGDATSELLKVMEDRQKRSTLTASGRAARLLSINPGALHDSSISPHDLAKSRYTTQTHQIRCTCNRNGGDENDGFMIQWYVLTSLLSIALVAESRETAG